MNRVAPFIRICRPGNSLLTFVAVCTAWVVAGGVLVPVDSVLLLGALAAALTAAAGNVINDIFDLEPDRINRPDRILPSGKLIVSTAMGLYGGLIISSLLIGFFFLSKESNLIILLTHLSLFFYSRLLKRLPLYGNLLISFLMGLAFIYGSVLLGNPIAGLVPAGFAFLFTFARELVKDLEDIEGDQTAQMKTFPVVYGIQSAKHLSISVICMSVMLLPVPTLSDYYGSFYLIVVIGFVGIPAIVLSVYLFLAKSKRDFSLISLVLKILILPSLLAISLDRYITL
ncbi:MAG: geranylgeranylglycerol-phosphate geranylgeranyltransferase [Bacteroidetes bacterium]|nr:geranylgeranylglycerol-phosphate geranylgeranyltransferase [Bacteroidota bacterium]